MLELRAPKRTFLGSGHRGTTEWDLEITRHSNQSGDKGVHPPPHQ